MAALTKVIHNIRKNRTSLRTIESNDNDMKRYSGNNDFQTKREQASHQPVVATTKPSSIQIIFTMMGK